MVGAGVGIGVGMGFGLGFRGGIGVEVVGPRFVRRIIRASRRRSFWFGLAGVEVEVEVRVVID